MIIVLELSIGIIIDNYNNTGQQIFFHFLLHEFFQLILYNFWPLISNLPLVFFCMLWFSCNRPFIILMYVVFCTYLLYISVQ